ncbi:uncharacterized protein LOC111108075 isoform X1 [Crassostrea virginica]
MIIRTMNNGLIAILLVNLWGSAHSGYWDKYTDSGSVFCSYNYFFDGKLCKECHRGSYGINCSSLCQPSTYGKFCSEKCNCWNSACHYLNIIGCNDPLTYINAAPEITPDGDKEKKEDINKTARYIFTSQHFGKILIISSGTVTSLTLMLLIGREIFKLYRISETSGNYQLGMATPVVNNTSGDITTSLNNS